MILACLQIYREILSLVTFLRVHSNSKEVSYLSWQNMYPNLKTTCHVRLKFLLWSKLLENLFLAKYLIFVAAPLMDPQIHVVVIIIIIIIIMIISQNRYKTKTAKFFVIIFIPKHESTKVKLRNLRIINRRSSFSMSSFFAVNDFHIINPTSKDFLLDWIYIKRSRSLCITLF